MADGGAHVGSVGDGGGGAAPTPAFAMIVHWNTGASRSAAAVELRADGGARCVALTMTAFKAEIAHGHYVQIKRPPEKPQIQGLASKRFECSAWPVDFYGSTRGSLRRTSAGTCSTVDAAAAAPILADHLPG